MCAHACQPCLPALVSHIYCTGDPLRETGLKSLEVQVQAVQLQRHERAFDCDLHGMPRTVSPPQPLCSHVPSHMPGFQRPWFATEMWFRTVPSLVDQAHLTGHLLRAALGHLRETQRNDRLTRSSACSNGASWCKLWAVWEINILTPYFLRGD